MTRRKLIAENRVREDQMNTRTDHRADRRKSAPPTRRDVRHGAGHAVRPRDDHSEAKAPRHDGQRELMVPRHHVAPRAMPRGEMQELTKQAGPVTGTWSDAATVLFLILAFANMVVFYWGLIVGF
jgi:hypothetical protein